MNLCKDVKTKVVQGREGVVCGEFSIGGSGTGEDYCSRVGKWGSALARACGWEELGGG